MLRSEERRVGKECILMEYVYKNNIDNIMYSCLLNYLEENIGKYELWCKLNIKNLDDINKLNYLRDMIIDDFNNKNNNNVNEKYIL